MMNDFQDIFLFFFFTIYDNNLLRILKGIVDGTRQKP